MRFIYFLLFAFLEGDENQILQLIHIASIEYGDE
jgi:hypothetical protein